MYDFSLRRCSSGDGRHDWVLQELWGVRRRIRRSLQWMNDFSLSRFSSGERMARLSSTGNYEDYAAGFGDPCNECIVFLYVGVPAENGWHDWVLQELRGVRGRIRRSLQWMYDLLYDLSLRRCSSGKRIARLISTGTMKSTSPNLEIPAMNVWFVVWFIFA